MIAPEHSSGVSDLDRKIIAATQRGLPLTSRPFRAIAETIGVTEEQVQSRMALMLQTGVIRRIGAIPNHYRLGVSANGMSVWDVADEHITELGSRVGKLQFVSHAYHRPRKLPEWPYNLFAMVHGHSRDEVLEKVGEIAEVLGKHQRGYDVLFSRRILKKTGFRINDAR